MASRRRLKVLTGHHHHARAAHGVGAQIVLGHVRIDHPPAALARALVLHAHEAIVQRQVVSDRVLPAGTARPVELLLEVGHILDDPVVDLRECEPLVAAALDGPRDQLGIRQIAPRVLSWTCGFVICILVIKTRIEISVIIY